MFVGCSFVKLVKNQIYVAITAIYRLCVSYQRIEFFAGISIFQLIDVQNRLSVFVEFYTHHTMIFLCPNVVAYSHRSQVCRTWTVGRRFRPLEKKSGEATPMHAATNKVYLQHVAGRGLYPLH